MTRVPFDDNYEPPAPVLPVRIAGMGDHAPAALLRMLVDTGADCTLIPVRIARSLRLPRIDKVSIEGVGGLAQSASVHAAKLRVGTLRATVRVVALGDEALLGRDVLNRLLMHVDGPAESLALVPRTKRPRRPK